jgi:hypothetical protein
MRNRAAAVALGVLIGAAACGRGETTVTGAERRVIACVQVERVETNPGASTTRSTGAPVAPRECPPATTGTTPVLQADRRRHVPSVPPTPPTTARYLYRRPGGYFEGTITAVRDLSPMEALTRLVAHPKVGPTDLATATAWYSHQPTPPYKALVIAVDRGDWTLILEEHGYLGVTDERIVALSEGTRAVAIHHFTDGGWCHFSFADNGRLVRNFGQEHYDGPHTVGARLPEEDDLALGDVSHSWEAVQELFRRIVGLNPFDELAAARPQDAVAAGHLPG